jgi:hypothetical protein
MKVSICCRSRILLTWHPWEQTGTKLSNILITQQNLHLPKFLQIFLLVLLNWRCTNIHSSVPFLCLLLVWGHQVLGGEGGGFGQSSVTAVMVKGGRLLIRCVHSWRWRRQRGAGNSASVDVETQLATFLVDCHTCRLFLSCRSIRIFGGSAFS